MNGTRLISEYLDGELSRDEAAALEARLEREPELRALLEDLRAVKDAAASRPELDAPPGLWDGIRRRIEAEPAGRSRTEPGARGRDSGSDARPGRAPRRRLTFTLPQLAAAAGIVLLLGVSLGRLASPGGSPVTDPIADRSPAGNAQPAAAGGYSLFIDDLEARLEAGRGALDPATARVIDESLSTIDAAIVQVRTALESDPDNVYLNRHLASARSRKLRLLEDATALIASRT